MLKFLKLFKIFSISATYVEKYLEEIAKSLSDSS